MNIAVLERKKEYVEVGCRRFRVAKINGFGMQGLDKWQIKEQNFKSWGSAAHKATVFQSSYEVSLGYI